MNMNEKINIIEFGKSIFVDEVDEIPKEVFEKLKEFERRKDRFARCIFSVPEGELVNYDRFL